MSNPTGNIAISLPNADGSITNLTAVLGSFTVTLTPPVVTPAPPPPPPVVVPEPTIPATAQVFDMLPVTVAWTENHDAGTPGSASGSTSYPATAPDGTVNCRKFQFTLTANGGEIFSARVLSDSSAFDTFCYETEEYYPDASNLACIERDLEQADATGLYVDMATQLNGHAGCLDYTSSNPKGWQHTAVKANPAAINPGWYITRRYFRNLGGGKVLYIGSFDNGVYSPLNITTESQPGPKWSANVLHLQYQFDGKSSASVASTVYTRKLRVHCWKS